MPIRHVARRVLPLMCAVALSVGAGAVSAAPEAPAVPTPAATAAPTRPDLVRIVRLKLSAADLASAEAWTEDWKRDVGADTTWLDARGWLARGAWMLGETERALAFARDVRAAIGEPLPEQLVPLGAALEVEGRITAERQGPAAGVRFFHDAQAKSTDVAFRSRMWKNINRLELVGRPAPPLEVADSVGGKARDLAALRGRPVLLFFWAAGCGDCKASAPTLASLHARFASRGLAIVAPTRLYGPGRDEKELTPEQEKAQIARALETTFAAVSGLAAPIGTAGMVRWGASATPTFALLDRAGTVRLYEPTRLTEAALAAAIEPLLAPGTPPA